MSGPIAFIAGLLGIVVALITIASALWKASSAIADLRRSNERLEAALRLELSGLRYSRELVEAALRTELAELQNENEKLVLIVNGVKERTEHVNLRLTGTVEKISNRVTDTEVFLQKTTAFEIRGNR